MFLGGLENENVKENFQERQQGWQEHLGLCNALSIHNTHLISESFSFSGVNLKFGLIMKKLFVYLINALAVMGESEMLSMGYGSER